MDLKKVEKNLTDFSDLVIKKIDADIKNLEKKSAKTEFDKIMKKNLKF